jgi:hypothetical protein
LPCRCTTRALLLTRPSISWSDVDSWSSEERVQTSNRSHAPGDDLLASLNSNRLLINFNVPVLRKGSRRVVL